MSDRIATSDRTAAGTRLRWRDHLVIAAAVVLIRLLGVTWRIRRIDGEEVARRIGAGLPNLYAFWHGHMLPLLIEHEGERLAMLVSSHRDGEIITRVARAFGFDAVRGSTSRDAPGALRSIVRTLRGGCTVGVTPDGPRGPAHVFAPGPAIASFETSIPIILAAVAADRAWYLRTWDRFMIPKPFARVVVCYQPSIAVPGPTARDAAAFAPTLGATLEQLDARARAAVA
jgi:lysophospholipid acyltransferase (LPLAT)-like uncharacterized protein